MNAAAWKPEDLAARERYRGWREDPVLWVRQVLKAEPDIWQVEGLQAIVREPRVGFSACAGPGKSAELAWVGLWWLDCHFDAQGIAASVTRDNLRDGLWKELATWYGKAPQLQAAFEFQGQRIVHRERPDTWWLAARGWAKDADANAQASALGGFHTKYPLFLLDEIGTLPDAVLVTAERIFTGGTATARLVAAWNPESTDGAAYRVSTRDRKRWTIIPITGDPDDPKRSPRVSIEWARQQIADWGRENDWVRVNVLGQFPRTASDKLLGPDEVTAAMQRGARKEDFQDEPKVMGLDVALFGGDRSVLTMRQGVMCWQPSVWRGLGPSDLADRVAMLATKHEPDLIFIDVTGGYGQGVYEDLTKLGFPCRRVDFGGSASDRRFLNKRAEMWWLAAEWVKAFGCLPPDPELAGELTAPSYRFKPTGKRTAFSLESKDDLKARGLPSPDKADSLVLTFAAPVMKRGSPFRQVFEKSTRESQDFQPAIG